VLLSDTPYCRFQSISSSISSSVFSFVSIL
jgi:hypothetical protein